MHAHVETHVSIHINFICLKEKFVILLKTSFTDHWYDVSALEISDGASGSFMRRAPNKFRRSLSRRGRRSSKVMSVEIEDIRDAGESAIVEQFREVLVSEDLLPAKHDDYHMMLR